MRPFLKKFKAQFNADVELFAPMGYDAVMVFIDAMKRAGSTDPAKFLPELQKTNYQGVIGPIAFDDKGDLVNGPLTIYVVKGGKWEPLETITPGAAPAPATAAAESCSGARQEVIASDPDSTAVPLNGTLSGAVFASQGTLAYGHLPPADHQRARARQHLCARGTGLHDGLRDSRTHQFRAWRHRDGRRAGRAHRYFAALRKRPAPLAVILIALAAATVVCMAIGLTVERLAYRPLRRAPRLAPLITAIGVSILLQYTAALVWGKQYISMPDSSRRTICNSRVRSLRTCRRTSSCLPARSWRRCSGSSNRAASGRAMRATEQNPDVAGLMGIDTNRIIAFTFRSALRSAHWLA